jgi:hypothetical protein
MERPYLPLSLGQISLKTQDLTRTKQTGGIVEIGTLHGFALPQIGEIGTFHGFVVNDLMFQVLQEVS